MTGSPSPRPTGLIQPDGSVLVPPSLARELLAVVVRDLAERARVDGGLVSPRARRVLLALHEAAERYGTSATGSVAEPPATVGAAVTVQEAAGLLECSARWVRYLAKTGRLSARRTGRVWLIDAADLERYRGGARDRTTR